MHTNFSSTWVNHTTRLPIITCGDCWCSSTMQIMHVMHNGLWSGGGRDADWRITFQNGASRGVSGKLFPLSPGIRQSTIDAERRARRSHAERGNEGSRLLTAPTHRGTNANCIVCTVSCQASHNRLWLGAHGPLPVVVAAGGQRVSIIFGSTETSGASVLGTQSCLARPPTLPFNAKSQSSPRRRGRSGPRTTSQSRRNRIGRRSWIRCPANKLAKPRGGIWRGFFMRW